MLVPVTAERSLPDANRPATKPALPSVAIQQLLRTYRGVLEEHFGERLLALTLFGSYARGEAQPNSDIDVAVIIDRIAQPSDRTLPMELAADFTVDRGLVISPLVLSVSELDYLRQREDLLAANLERDGIPI
jgi:uncharacterized protein